MGIIRPPITSDEASQAMLDGLTDRIRQELRSRILERINPDIDAAIDAALASLKTAIEAYHETHLMRDTIRVLVERKGSAPSGG